jgi:hypothetical protein
MFISEDILRQALIKFFDGARIPPLSQIPGASAKAETIHIQKYIVPAFIEALKEIEDVRFSYRFDPSYVWRPEDRYPKEKKNNE